MNHPAELLAHDEWLRPMVRSLVAAHEVDDVLQDTWLAAMRRPPPTGLRRWLYRVARNFAVLRYRRNRRRRRREGLAASRETLPSTAETVQKLALQAAVAKAVSELAEPYREAIILRFHDGLDYAAVARAQGTSVENARQRVSRGLARLRTRLTDEGGPGWQRGCAAALLCRPSEVSRPLFAVGNGILGVWIMKKSIVVGAAALVLLGTLVFVASPFASEPAAPEATPSAPPMVSSTGTARGATVADPRTVQPRTALPPSTPEQTGALPFRGRVLDTTARPLADVEVMAVVISEELFQRVSRTGDMGDFEPVPEPIGVTGADGQFSFDHDGRIGRMALRSPWVLLRGPDDLIEWDRGEEITVIAAPAASVQGTVSNTDGLPMAGVDVEVQVSDLVDFPLSLDPTTEAVFEDGETEPDGSFSIEQLPGDHTRLVFHKPGYQRVTLDLRPGPQTGSVVLQPLTEGRFTLIGTVSDHTGRPLGQARVGIDTVDVRTDRFGSFRLDLDQEALSAGPLYAAATGMQTWLHEDPRSLFGESPERQLNIVLPGKALQISGRVVDPKGQPQAGIHVRLWEETAIVGKDSAADLSMPAARGHDDRPPVYAITAADGSFTLGGLQDKDYKLRLRDGETYLAWTEGPVRAGRENLVLTAPVDKFLAELHGRVVGRDGSPLSGVKVTFSVQIDNMPPSNSWSGPKPDGVLSGSDGGFIFENVPIADDVLLVTSGDDVIVQLHYFSPDELQDDVVLELFRRCRFRVELTRPGAFARIQIRDGNDELVWIWEHRGNSNYSDRTFRLTDGKTPVLSASESAQYMVFLGEDGEEIERMPVRLIPGQVNLIQR